MPHKSLGRSLAREDAPIARAVGQRIREARREARLTQQQLADGRYTKAYISALENGLAKPSLAALSFIATKLGLAPASFLREDDPAWRRAEADLALVAGDLERALDGYTALLATETRPLRRAELERAIAEALVRLGRPAEAAVAAARSVEAFDAEGAPADAATSRYWLAAAHTQLDRDAEAAAILGDVLGLVRSEVAVDPLLEPRILLSLAGISGRQLRPRRARRLIREAHATLGESDARRRATRLASLAVGFRERGETGAALRLGYQAVGLLRDLELRRELATIQDQLGPRPVATRRRGPATSDATAAGLLGSLDGQPLGASPSTEVLDPTPA